MTSTMRYRYVLTATRMSDTTIPIILEGIAILTQSYDDTVIGCMPRLSQDIFLPRMHKKNGHTAAISSARTSRPSPRLSGATLIVFRWRIHFWQIRSRFQRCDVWFKSKGTTIAQAMSTATGFPTPRSTTQSTPPLEDPRDADGIVYPYFDGIRMPDEVEIRTKVGAADPISVHLLDAGAPPEGVCVALCHDDPCGGGFPELYETRPIWAVFLEIRNISAHSVALHTLHGLVDDPQPSYRRSVTPAGAPASMGLPSVAILPNQSVLAPLGVLLGPLQERLPSAIHGEATELARAHYQQVDRIDYSSIAHGVGLLGTMIWPSSITAERGDTSLTQQFHELDFARVYTIDRYWAMGSCPFLFFRSQDGEVQYVRELFADGLTRRARETITVPPGVGGMIVAELERETTYVESMSVNGRHQWINLELHRGDWWELSVGCGDVIHLVGGYVPELPGRQEPLYHNQLICDFIADQDTSRATQP